jgi:acetylglutamate kinase
MSDATPNKRPRRESRAGGASERLDGQRGTSIGTLLEALPYIREFHGKTVVIKCGGAAMDDARLREDFARDVVLLKYVGLNPIVVHGGGPEITAYMERLGLPVEFVGGLRISDAETVEVAKMVLVGKINKEIVTRLNRHGAPAVGLCGDDGLLFRVSRREGPDGQDIGYVGAIERVNVDVIEHVARDYIPVIASVGADREGSSYNVNADEAAGAVARALRAFKVIFLTDVVGWLRDEDEPQSLIASSSAEHVRTALAGLSGGMRPKLEACVRAIDGGVSSAHIIDGRLSHSLLLELFTDAGIGTKIEASA